MRVLHIVSGRLYGGVETALVTMARCRSLCPELEPEFALCFDGRLSDELTAAATPVHMLGEVRVRHPLSILRARHKLRELLDGRAANVVVCHMAWAQAIFGPVARAARIPLIFWAHDAIETRHWLDRWAQLTPPDLAICNSHFTAATILRLYPRVPTQVVYCPVTPPAFSASLNDRAEVRREFNTPPDATVIVQVSRMERWKGQELHLETLGRMRDLPGWVCWMIGAAQRPNEVRYERELHAAAKQYGIEDRVRFAGQRSDVPRILSAADIFCQPNTGPEPFGLTLIEALQAGLPVITSAMGGATEVVNDSCGVLVRPGSVADLALALRLLVNDAQLRRRLGASGPARARELTDPAVQLSRLRSALGELPVTTERNSGRESLDLA
jgi:glycosyltransferase involved in cell wall biosynthesis